MPDSNPPRSRTRATRLLALSIGLVCALAAAEATLRASGVYSTYSERNYGDYRDVLGREQEGWLHVWPANTTQELSTAEFSYTYSINADGVRDLPREPIAEPGRKRIVVLGDSFAEGVGADRHEAWPAVLGDRLESEGLSVEVLNAGVSGSDPCFAYQLLRQRFLRYRPDLVILAINDSDISDVVWWGGLERFHPDGRTRGRPRPAAFLAYRHSHLARWMLHSFFGLDRTTFAFGEPGRVNWDAQRKLVETCAAIAGLRAEHPFEFLVLVHPVPDSLRFNRTWYFNAFFDQLTERGIASVNLTAPLGEALAGVPYEEYAWPIDCHFNAYGYSVFARTVERVLREGGSNLWELPR